MVTRTWLLTNTTYGTWLPGDERGFIGGVCEIEDGSAVEETRSIQNQVGEIPPEKLRGLQLSARSQMKGPPILLTLEQAQAALDQFLETARFRGWTILAAAIMANHFHIVVEVPGDPDPSKVLGDFKGWGTRRLSREYGEPASETWWTEKGSKRTLKSDAAIRDAIEYVLNQYKPLVVYRAEGRASG